MTMKAKPVAADAEADAPATPPRNKNVAPPPVEIPDAEPPEKFSSLAREYIGLSVAGGLVIGLVIGALFPRSTAKRVAKRSAVLADVGMALATQALARAGAAARETRDKAVDMGEIVGESIASHAGPAREKATQLLEDGAGLAREQGSTLAKKAAGIVDKLRSHS